MPAETGEIIYYERQSPLEYKGTSAFRKINTKREDLQGGFAADYYSIKPELLRFGVTYYNRDKERITASKGEHLVKKAMVLPEFISR